MRTWMPFPTALRMVPVGKLQVRVVVWIPLRIVLEWDLTAVCRTFGDVTEILAVSFS